MKRIILLFVFITALGYSQECKFDINEVDAFTKLEKIKTAKQVVAVTTSTAIYFSFFRNENTYLDLTYHTSGIKSIVVGRYNILRLMFSDETIVDLTPVNIFTGEFDAMNNTNIKPKYLINLEVIKKIRIIGLKKIRFNTSKFYYDFDVTKQKWIVKLNDQIDCFLNEIK